MPNYIIYLNPFILSFAISSILTITLVIIGNRQALYSAKRSDTKVSRMGGAAIILSFLIAMTFSGVLVFDKLKWGIVISSLVLLLWGVFDDLRGLSWKKQFILQLLTASTMLIAGLNVEYIANPFGGTEFRLDQHYVYGFPLLGSVFVLFWILGFMNVVNWLDGLDGLAGGVGFIGAISLFLISVSDLVNQPPLGIMAIILAGSILGFLVFNLHPARIFMGTSGSMFLGFMLAVIAVFSGGKIATALLVMGFPIIDAMWVIIERLKFGRSPFMGDTRHIHHRLLTKGWSHKKIAVFVYTVSAIFAIFAIVFQNTEKIASLFVLFVFANYFIYKYGIKGEKSDIIDTKRVKC